MVMHFGEKLKIIILFFTEFMFTYSATPKSAAPPSKCTTCRIIVDKFIQGLSKTSKSNFGGGNTRWEEENLGKYAFSETRLIEILENICIGQDKECHQMLETQEELLEMWWRKYYARQVESDLGEYLCVRRMKVCCMKGTYGPDCRDCRGGRYNPCNRNGRCDGDGTKEGTGECICDIGFKGFLCHECSDAYFDLNPEDQKVKAPNPLQYRPNCVPCHESCQSTCTKKGPEGCIVCKDGWVMMDSIGCSDLNECEDATMCASNEFCTNTEGSYKCIACHKACERCTGANVSDCITCSARHFMDGDTCTACHDSCARSCTDRSPKSCGQCRKGWKMDEEGECQDVDECGMANVTLRCLGDEYCVNTVGSYRCSTCHPNCDGCHGAGNNKCTRCKDGYHRDEEDSCIDLDECLKPDEACPGSNKKCVNLPGTYRCDCITGHKLQGGLCIHSSKVGSVEDGRSTSSYSTSNNQKKTQDEARKVKKVKRNVPLYKRELPQYLARLAGFTVVCSLAKGKWLIQAIVSAAFVGYLYFYSGDLDGAYKRV